MMGRTVTLLRLKLALIPRAGLDASPLSHCLRRGAESPRESLHGPWCSAQAGGSFGELPSPCAPCRLTGSSSMLTPNTSCSHGAHVPKSFSRPTKASPCPTTEGCPKSSSLWHEAFPSLALARGWRAHTDHEPDWAQPDFYPSRPASPQEKQTPGFPN